MSSGSIWEFRPFFLAMPQERQKQQQQHKARCLRPPKLGSHAHKHAANYPARAAKSCTAGASPFPVEEPPQRPRTTHTQNKTNPWGAVMSSMCDNKYARGAEVCLAKNKALASGHPCVTNNVRMECRSSPPCKGLFPAVCRHRSCDSPTQGASHDEWPTRKKT